MHIHLDNHNLDSSFTPQDLLSSEKMDHDETMFFCDELSAFFGQEGAFNNWNECSSSIDDDMDTVQGSLFLIGNNGNGNPVSFNFLEPSLDERNEIHIPSLDEDFEFDELSFYDDVPDQVEVRESSDSGSSFESKIEETKSRLQESMRRSQLTRLSICLKSSDIDVFCGPKRLEDAIKSVQESSIQLQSYLN